MPMMNEFFQQAGEATLAGDPALSENLARKLMELQMQQNQMLKVLNVASQMGEDVSLIVPMASELMQRQQGLIQQLASRSLVPTSATQVNPNIPQPRLR